MEFKAHHSHLVSKIYQESSTISWCIKGFNKMPFLEDHPVCGPWFTLGKKRQSTWTLLMTKQVHHGLKNVGFKLVRAEDETMWDVMEYRIGLKTVDGWSVDLSEKQVVGKESSNSYVFLLGPTGCSSDEKGLAIVENCCMTGVKGSTTAENYCSSEESFGEKSKNVAESTSLWEKREQPEKQSRVILEGSGHKSDSSVSMDGSTNVGNSSSSDRLGNVKNIEISKELPKPTVTDNKSDMQHQSTEELFQQENITVVCKIQYTYMMNDPIPDEEKSEHSDITANFRDLFNSGKFSDITLKCEDVRFLCHKAIICTRSPLFRSFLDKQGSTQDLVLKPVLDKESSARDVTLRLDLEKDDSAQDASLKRNLENEGSVQDPVLKLDLDKGSSRDLVEKENLDREDSVQDLVQKKTMDRKVSSRDLLQKRNLGKEYSVQDLVLKLNLDLTTAKAMLLYVYTDEFDDEIIKTVDECRRLCKAAEQFGMPGLKKLCLEFLRELEEDEDEEETEINLDQEFSPISICSEEEVSVGEKAPPLTHIGTQTSISH